MLAKLTFNQCKHIYINLIPFKIKLRGQGRTARPSFTIGAVIVPLLSNGLLSLHQVTGLLAHFPVKIFHTQCLVATGPVPELLRTTEKTFIIQALYWQLQLLAPILFNLLL